MTPEVRVAGGLPRGRTHDRGVTGMGREAQGDGGKVELVRPGYRGDEVPVLLVVFWLAVVLYAGLAWIPAFGY